MAEIDVDEQAAADLAAEAEAEAAEAAPRQKRPVPTLSDDFHLQAGALTRAVRTVAHPSTQETLVAAETQMRTSLARMTSLLGADFVRLGSQNLVHYALPLNDVARMCDDLVPGLTGRRLGAVEWCRGWTSTLGLLAGGYDPLDDSGALRAPSAGAGADRRIEESVLQGRPSEAGALLRRCAGHLKVGHSKNPDTAEKAMKTAAANERALDDLAARPVTREWARKAGSEATGALMGLQHLAHAITTSSRRAAQRERAASESAGTGVQRGQDSQANAAEVQAA